MINEIITTNYVRTCDCCKKTINNNDFYAGGYFVPLQHDENSEKPNYQYLEQQQKWLGSLSSEFCLECYEEIVINGFLEFKKKLSLKAFW